MNDNRIIRVFISSTFRDMMRERDLLVKQVFPALRRICAQRFVTFIDVDLRWGITEEQAAEGKVLPLCLAEIERSRPYFLGLLGERYGWIPDAIPEEVIDREPWLKEHLHGCTSVTELEILHGVLNNPEMHHHVFFYFRDPAWLDNLPENELRQMVERNITADVENYGEAEATQRTEERKAKLATLKERIRQSGLPLVENYASPEALAEMVLKQFETLLDQLFPKEDVPDPLDQEAMAHEAHARQKLFACIDRPTHIASINSFASAPSTGQGLVVTGESGGGKTSLLAAWARDWAREHTDDFLFQHYFGATPESASPDGFLRRLLGELKRNFGITEEIPTQPDKMREALPLWLAQTVGTRRIVLILDGLNQVQGEEPDRRLLFLPRFFPPHVTVVASALEGTALDVLRERGWAEHGLPLADEAEIDAMVDAYLTIHARTLRDDLRRRIIIAPGAKNPLYLRTLLDELRQFGSFEKLPERVAHYLEADNPRDLFLRVIRRWQEDFDGGIDLVRQALIHLWAARQGLSEPEWLELLGKQGEPLPRAYWTPLFPAMEVHLSQRAGLFAFGHDFVRQAVEMEFLSVVDDRMTTHLAIADYFGAQEEMTPRKAAEWPWQLHAADAWQRLEACLTDIPLFLALYNHKTKWELTSYWHPLREMGRNMGDCYINVYKHLAEYSENGSEHFVPALLGSFLMENGLYRAAKPLLQRALAVHERDMGPDHRLSLLSLNSMGLLLMSEGDYAAAQTLYLRTLASSEQVLGREDPLMLAFVSNLARLLDLGGDYMRAQMLYERVLASRERVLGAEHPDTLMSVNNLAMLLYNKGEYANALPLSMRALAVRERVLGQEHPDTLTSMNNLALLLYNKGDYTGAQPLYKRALAACERVLGREHPLTLTCVNNLAKLLMSKGDNTEAQILNILKKALLKSKRNSDYSEAQSLFEWALAARERVLGPEHPLTLSSVNNLAGLLKSVGEYATAQSLYVRALASNERVLGLEHPQTLTSLNDLASLLVRKGDFSGALSLFERALSGWVKVSRAIGKAHPDLLIIVDNYSGTLNKLGHSRKQILAELRKQAPEFF